MRSLIFRCGARNRKRKAFDRILIEIVAGSEQQTENRNNLLFTL
jgi:hypothetical protein